jgi:hypothetical protein
VTPRQERLHERADLHERPRRHGGTTEVAYYSEKRVGVGLAIGIWRRQGAVMPLGRHGPRIAWIRRSRRSSNWLSRTPAERSPTRSSPPPRPRRSASADRRASGSDEEATR